MPARLQDRRPDLGARRLRGRRATDADRSRHLTYGRRVGDEQLAGYRQLFSWRPRSVIDPLRWTGRGYLLRHGQTRPVAADRTGETVLGSANAQPRGVSNIKRDYES